MGILNNQLVQSILGLKGGTPATREGALKTSQKHYKDDIKSQTADHSVQDLDGKKPDVYTHPETGATFN